MQGCGKLSQGERLARMSRCIRCGGSGVTEGTWRTGGTEPDQPCLACLGHPFVPNYNEPALCKTAPTRTLFVTPNTGTRMKSLSKKLAEYSKEHQRLLAIMPKRPGDYEPWGQVKRWADDSATYPDCSWGCKFAIELAGDRGADWAVCTNPKSHRVGLLTFEHQGCQAFEEIIGEKV